MLSRKQEVTKLIVDLFIFLVYKNRYYIECRVAGGKIPERPTCQEKQIYFFFLMNGIRECIYYFR